MRMAVEIEVYQIRQSLFGPGRRDTAAADEAPECLGDLDVGEVRRVELVVRAKETGLDARAERRLQKKLEQR